MRNEAGIARDTAHANKFRVQETSLPLNPRSPTHPRRASKTPLYFLFFWLRSRHPQIPGSCMMPSCRDAAALVSCFCLFVRTTLNANALLLHASGCLCPLRRLLAKSPGFCGRSLGSESFCQLATAKRSSNMGQLPQLGVNESCSARHEGCCNLRVDSSRPRDACAAATSA